MSPAAGRLTARLRLEPIGTEHAEDLHLLHADPGIASWYGGSWTRTEALHRARLMSRQWARDGVGKWIAYSRDDGALVGRGGLSVASVAGRRRLEVGWAVRRHLWGRGLATEIGRAALDLAFGELRAEEVVSFTEAHNASSRRVMERLGMHLDGEIVRPGLVPGRAGVHAEATFVLYVIDRNHREGPPGPRPATP